MSAYDHGETHYVLYVVNVILYVWTGRIARQVTCGQVYDLCAIFFHVGWGEFQALSGAASAGHPAHDFYGFPFWHIAEDSVAFIY